MFMNQYANEILNFTWPYKLLLVFNRTFNYITRRTQISKLLIVNYIMEISKRKHSGLKNLKEYQYLK